MGAAPAVIIAALIIISTTSVADPSSQLCEGESFEIALGQEVVFNEDLVIESPCDIIIYGAILGESGSGADLTLEATRSVIVHGLVQAGSGADGMANGLGGQNGGSIHVSYNPTEGSFFGGPAAMLAAGDGGKGISIVGAPVEAYDEACGCLVAGDGGDGGLILMNGASSKALWLGTMVAGSGGDGGHIASGTGQPIQGGNGGNAGHASFAQDLTMPWLMRNNAPQAGAGGSALAGIPNSALLRISTPPTQLVGDGGEHKQDECEAAALASNFVGLIAGLTTVTGTTLPAPISGGSLDASATGGNGGDGLLEGGPGGKATAVACDNTDAGDNGAVGANDSWQIDLGCPQCPAKYKHATAGNPGNQGNPGGAGTGTGGDGGMGLLQGGAGAGGEGNGGTGSPGGNGGKGGDSNAGICKNGANGGNAGQGGSGGKATGNGGNGGDALLVIGTGGQAGLGAGKSGPGGPAGQPGVGGQPSYVSAGASWVVGISCNPRQGNPGDTNSAGTSPTTDLNPGEHGGSGGKTPAEGIEYLTGIDIYDATSEYMDIIQAIVADCMVGPNYLGTVNGYALSAASNDGGPIAPCTTLKALIDDYDPVGLAQELVGDAQNCRDELVQFDRSTSRGATDAHDLCQRAAQLVGSYGEVAISMAWSIVSTTQACVETFGLDALYMTTIEDGNSKSLGLVGNDVCQTAASSVDGGVGQAFSALGTVSDMVSGCTSKPGLKDLVSSTRTADPCRLANEQLENILKAIY